MVVEVACQCDDLPAHSHVYHLVIDSGKSPMDPLYRIRHVPDEYDVRIWVDWKAVAREVIMGSLCFYEIVWTDEVGDVPVCKIHGQNSKHEPSTNPHRPCLVLDPWPEVSNG